MSKEYNRTAEELGEKLSKFYGGLSANEQRVMDSLLAGAKGRPSVSSPVKLKVANATVDLTAIVAYW